SLFTQAPYLTNVGSRNYSANLKSVAKTRRTLKLMDSGDFSVDARMLFVRSSDAGYRHFVDLLNRPEGSLPKKFKEEIQCIERFDLLSPSEQFLGFEKNWTEGRVELVLHPSSANED